MLAMPFFPELITPERWARYKRVLHLDGEDGEAEQAVRVPIEDGFLRELELMLGRQLDEILPAGSSEEDVRRAIELLLLAAATEALRLGIRRWLLIGADVGVHVAIDQLSAVGMGLDWAEAHVEAAQWASRHAGELVGGLNATSRRRIEQAVSDYFETGGTVRGLRRELRPFFGRDRARVIAQTEITRAAYEGAMIAYRQSGVVTGKMWMTAADERVCPICGALHGVMIELEESWMEVDTGVTYRPPAHVNCRCWIVPVVL